MKLFTTTPETKEQFIMDNACIRKEVSRRRRSCMPLFCLRPDTSLKRRREARLLSNNIDTNKYMIKKGKLS